ncbi:predicted protein [Botrytis cinerea T4]|uniref:Uncharacterized protein n=1 Tax=Botryotinia fuckeliana (strain T4) TaxID=999810 RepID=G2YQH8_BOTF4|nr:predicted protein [Botrytis cinerea T4]
MFCLKQSPHENNATSMQFCNRLIWYKATCSISKTITGCGESKQRDPKFTLYELSWAQIQNSTSPQGNISLLNKSLHKDGVFSRYPDIWSMKDETVQHLLTSKCQYA